MKGRMLGQALDSIGADPLGVQFAARWIRTLLPGHSPLNDRIPWMNFRAWRWLRSYLKPEMRVFEYGSGGSTLFLAKRVANVVSVEHDVAWYEFVADALREDGVWNCDLRMVPPEERRELKDAPYDPASFASEPPEGNGFTFERYVRSIDEFPDRSFDLVIVDGFARHACVAESIGKVRPGGYFLIDDTDWEKYHPACRLLAGFPRTDFVGITPFQLNIRQTSVWRL